MTAPAPRPHAEFSPSGLKSLEVCPSFRNRKGTSEKAERGERLHAHVERNDSTSLTDAEEQRQVQFCIDYHNNLVGTLKGKVEVIDETLLPIGEGVWVRGNPDNKQVGDLGPNGEPLGYASFGYPDRIIVSDSGVDILDWKFGEWEVADASDNLQGMAYAVGVFETYLACEKVTVHFVQPPLNKATKVVFTREDYPFLRTRILYIIKQAKQDDPSMRVFNKETCRFCSRLHLCSAPTDAIEKLVSTYRSGLRLDPSKWPTVHSSHVTDADTAEQMLEVAGIVTEWAASVKHHVLNAVLDAKLKLNNYAVSERKGRVTITNSESALALLRGPALQLNDHVLSRSVDIDFTSLLSEVAAAYGAQMQAKVLNTLQSSGFLIESEPATFLRRTKTKSKP